MRLRTKLLLMLSTPIACGIGVLSASLFQVSRDKLERLSAARLEQTAEMLALQSAQWLGHLRSETAVLAQAPVVVEAAQRPQQGDVTDRCNRLFQGVIGQLSVYQSLNLLDRDGWCIASSHPQRIGFAPMRETVVARSDFRDALQGKNAASETLVSQATGRPCFTISAPVQDGEKVAAVLWTVIDLEHFNERYVAPLKVGQRGAAFVFAPRLYSDLVGAQPEDPDSIVWAKYVPPNVPLSVQEQMLRQRHGIIGYSRHGHPQLAAFRSLEPRDWVFVVELPKDEAREPIREIAWAISAVAFVLLGAIFGLVYVASASAVKALQSCAAFAKEIQQGRRDNRLVLAEGDEIGDLARSLNAMAASLQEQERALVDAERRYRGIFEETIEGIFQTTEDGTVVAANPACARLLGFEAPEALIGRNAKDFYADPKGRDTLLAALQQDGQIADFEFEFLRAGGERRRGLLKASLRRNAQDAAGLIQGCLEDITGRRQAERDRQRVVEAERLLVESRLETLRYQMNPHFLFNALNSVEALSREAPARIPEVVRGLSEYLRYSLQPKQDGLATLQQELDAVASYLRVEKVRFEDQLEVELEIAEAARRQRVPELLLQPLVENAVKHGMHTSALPLRVIVRACCADRRLHVEVRNSGAWSAAVSGGGIGLDNLQRRLDLLYGDGYRLAARERAGWVTTTVEIPLERCGERNAK